MLLIQCKSEKEMNHPINALGRSDNNRIKYNKNDIVQLLNLHRIKHEQQNQQQKKQFLCIKMQIRKENESLANYYMLKSFQI